MHQPQRRQAMAEAEANRADGIEAVTIVTPNNSHYEIAKAFLAQGIDVICDKPLTTAQRGGAWVDATGDLA